MSPDPVVHMLKTMSGTEIPLPKMKRSESLQSFLEGDELMKWLRLVLTKVISNTI